MKNSRSVSLRDVHEFMWSKRNRRDLLKCDQKALAIEFDTEQTKFHRLVNQLLDEGKLKIVAVGSRGGKTYKVYEPDPMLRVPTRDGTGVTVGTQAAFDAVELRKRDNLHLCVLEGSLPESVLE